MSDKNQEYTALDIDEGCGSPAGQHEPDWHSVSTHYDGDTLYIDVNCKHCGLSGCVGTDKTLAEDITWN
jgi:hypothetical protein|tara:strand:+ start:8185 stop:8391 length:207 start_codon:yes stop_codon:yes gene_type:complete